MEQRMKRFKKKHKHKNPGAQPTQEELEIAKYVRFQAPRKSTMINKQSVEYFLGNKAVDVLMASKWATGKKNTEILFPTREDATVYLNELLQKKFFYRAMKNETEVKKKQEEEKNSDNETTKIENQKKETETNNGTETKLRRRKKGKQGEGDEAVEDGKNKDKNKSKEKKPKEKVKKRYKLSVHTDQKFKDSKDIYIWLYNPVSPKTIIMGLGVLLCVIAATLFPLWPPQVRVGVYYASVAGGIFIGSIFGVAFARSVLYGALWLFSGGKHHLWILPNILADVGFFDSFKPFYTYEYKGDKKKNDDIKETAEQDDADESQEEEEDEQDALEKEEVQKNQTESTESTAESNTESIPP